VELCRRPPRCNAELKPMLRALAITFAMLAVGVGPCVAEKASAARVNEDSSKEVSSHYPTPHSNLAAGSSSGEDSAAENELLELANKSREVAGIPPFRVDESLRAAARGHAERMVASDQLEHRLPGELPLLERIAQASSLKMDRAGENIAYADSGAKANDALMRSPPHRENLLDPGFNAAGIAAIWSKGRLYVVQDFAHEVPSYSAQQTVKLIGHAVGEIRQQAGLPELIQQTPPKLDEAVCSMSRENPPNARLLATAYDNRRIITYTQSRPEVLPAAAIRMLRDPASRQFAVGACYGRSAAYPTGTYWVAILLY
jgi:uncharacterized protein YkwD